MVDRNSPVHEQILAKVRDLLCEAERTVEPLAALGAERLLAFTRARLLDVARVLGVVGRHRLPKAALAQAVEQMLATLGVTEPAPTEETAPGPTVASSPAAASPPAITPPAAARSTAPPPAPVVVAPPLPAAYGVDRITAMAVDPDRLYCYWEVGAAAVARARRALDGPDASLALRVFDVTGRLFDGTNARGWTDQPIGPADHQWFLTIERPGTTVVVEVGVVAPDGRWARLARSRRVDFPRREPAPAAPPAWMTVTTGPEGEPVVADGPAPATPEAPRPLPPASLSRLAPEAPSRPAGGASERVAAGASERLVRLPA